MSSSMMIKNHPSNNLMSSTCSSPILKRHKKMMDDDSIGKVSTTTTTTISNLAEELLAQILVRLSVKDILVCLCVKKSWFSLIKTRKFITLHSNHQKKIISNLSNKYLLFLNSHTRANEIRVDDIQCEKYLTLKYPAHLSNQGFDFRLVSNGLICLSSVTVCQDIYLWNPVIHKSITLPHSPPPPSSCRKTQWKGIAFGFIQEINDYVVVYMAKYGGRPRNHIITCVYNISTNSWKQITHHNTNIGHICLSESIIVNGIAIWIGYNSRMDRILVCFDTKTGMLREILSPKSRGSHSVIRALDQSIVYFVEKKRVLDSHDMWILKGDPMNEFVWEKKMMIREKAFVGVLGLRNNGEPILRKSFDLISYNLESHESYDFVKSWDSWEPFPSLNGWKPHSFWEDSHTWLPFIIKPFAESLGLLDI